MNDTRVNIQYNVYSSVCVCVCVMYVCIYIYTFHFEILNRNTYKINSYGYFSLNNTNTNTNTNNNVKIVCYSLIFVLLCVTFISNLSMHLLFHKQTFYLQNEVVKAGRRHSMVTKLFIMNYDWNE